MTDRAHQQYNLDSQCISTFFPLYNSLTISPPNSIIDLSEEDIIVLGSDFKNHTATQDNQPENFSLYGLSTPLDTKFQANQNNSESFSKQRAPHHSQEGSSLEPAICKKQKMSNKINDTPQQQQQYQYNANVNSLYYSKMLQSHKQNYGELLPHQQQQFAALSEAVPIYSIAENSINSQLLPIIPEQQQNLSISQQQPLSNTFQLQCQQQQIQNLQQQKQQERAYMQQSESLVGKKKCQPLHLQSSNNYAQLAYGQQQQSSNILQMSSFDQLQNFKNFVEDQKYDWVIEDILISKDNMSELMDPDNEERLLGKGSFGKVMKAKDNNSNQSFALKFIKPSFLSRATQEMNIMQHLSMSGVTNVIQFHDIYLYEARIEKKGLIDIRQYIVIVMELGSASLEEVLECRSESDLCWTDEELISIMMQICQGFESMKQNSICHRDIKPSNILYCQQEQCYKIADLGEAKFLNETDFEMLHSPKGTRKYMSPELFNQFQDRELKRQQLLSQQQQQPVFQFQCKNNYFEEENQNLKYEPWSSDVFSLGITFFLMKHLVVQKSRSEMMSIIKEHYQQTDQLDQIDLIIQSMLNPDPKIRPSFEKISQLLSKAYQELREKQKVKDFMVSGSADRLSSDQLLQEINGNCNSIGNNNEATTASTTPNSVQSGNSNYFVGKILQNEEFVPPQVKSDLGNHEEILSIHVDESNILNLIEIKKEKAKTTLQQIHFLLKKAEVYEKLFKFHNAAAIYEEILTSSGLNNTTNKEKLQVYNNYGLLKMKLSQYNQAIEYFNLALDLLHQQQQQQQQVAQNSASNNQDQIRQQAFQDVDSEEEEANLQIQIQISKFLHQLGQVYSHLGDYQNSLLYFQQSLDLKLSLRISQVEVVDSIASIGQVYKNLGKFQLSLQQYKQAYEKLSHNYQLNLKRISHVLLNMGLVYDHLHEFNEAIPVLEEALRAATQAYSPNHEKVAYCLNKLAFSMVHSGQHEKSLQLFEESFKILKNLYKIKSLDNAEAKFSEHISRKDIPYVYKRALEVNEEAYQFYYKIWGYQYIAIPVILEIRGMVFHFLEEYELAEKYFDEALQSYNKLLRKEHVLVKRATWFLKNAQLKIKFLLYPYQ